LARNLSVCDVRTRNRLGFSAANNITDILNQIQKKIDNKCKSKVQTNAANVSDTMVTACRWRFVKDSNDRSACIINTLQEMANELQRVYQPESNYAIWDLSTSYNQYRLMMIIVIILSIIIIISMFI
jgi:hypothetical protein